MISTVRRFLPSSRRAGSLALVPLLVVALLMSVIIPALEMQRVTRVLNEITTAIGPTRGVSERLEQVAGHERQSLFVNAVLVMVALGAIGVVISVSRRERRLTAVLEQRVTSETALREAAEALAAAFTTDDVAQQVARSALEATQADGAFVVTIDSAPDGSFVLMVRGVAGTSMPALGTTHHYPGSFIEHAIDEGAPSIVVDYRIAYPPGATVQRSDESRPAIVLPIRHPRGPIGALLIVGASKSPFTAGDTGWAQTITHLAALAYEKVRLLDEARGGRQALETVMKSRQRLLRGFSHDVKNPLGAADGYADLLIGGIYGELPENQKESVKRIRRSIRRALDLIDDLHELARTETGHIVLHREVVDIGELVRTSADEYRGAAYAAGLSLTLDVAEDLPLVETDSVRVNQIVGNLVSNAIKYTKTGAVTLRVRRYPAAEIRNVPPWVDIEVVDTGRGIPPDKKEQIFEEFSRLDTSDRPGAGLGLAISKRLAQALQGEITVQSEVGSGSTFTLRIPVSIPDESNPAPQSQLLHEFHSDRKTASAGV